jgi:transposase
MLALNARLRVWVAAEPADFRCGIDGLARRVRQKLAQDPFSGGVFVFCNRRRTAVKLLVYDGQGFWLCQKRLSQGHYRFWPQESPGKLLAPHALAVQGTFKKQLAEIRYLTAEKRCNSIGEEWNRQ